jgi:polyhydroxyalkanoate synthase
MTITPPSAHALEYLESLMRAGQDAMKQFDDALASVAGVRAKEANSLGPLSPIGLVADLQRDLFKHLWQFWNTAFLQTFAGGAHSNAVLARGDKRFKDEAWHEMPYYDLIKQSYLLGSRQLHDFVDRAQVDDKTKLQLRFYVRQYIDAMSPSNFPATNPEVIRKAIETRSASLTDGIRNLIDDLQKGRITRVDESAFEVGRNLAITPGTVVRDTEASCPRARCRWSQAAFRPGSGKRRRLGHIESRCARRCHHPASIYRTQGYVARCLSPRPASSASEPPHKRYPRQAALA